MLGQEAASVESEYAELLLAIDRVLYLNTEHGSYAETVEFLMSDGQGGEYRAVAEMKLAIDGDEYRALIRTIEPEAQAGTAHLVLEDETIYLCTPDLEMPMQLSGATDLFGDASITATAGLSYSHDYGITAVSNEEVGGAPVLRIELAAALEDFPYPAATLWVQPLTYVPIRATLYALSGEPLVAIEYLEYQMQGDDSYLLRQRVRNLLGQGTATELRILDVSNRTIPAEEFDPAMFCGAE
jgi:hypothetical protein